MSLALVGAARSSRSAAVRRLIFIEQIANETHRPVYCVVSRQGNSPSESSAVCARGSLLNRATRH